jgi:hypothetical protein
MRFYFLLTVLLLAPWSHGEATNHTETFRTDTYPSSALQQAAQLYYEHHVLPHLDNDMAHMLAAPREEQALYAHPLVRDNFDQGWLLDIFGLCMHLTCIYPFDHIFQVGNIAYLALYAPDPDIRLCMEDSLQSVKPLCHGAPFFHSQPNSRPPRQLAQTDYLSLLGVALVFLFLFGIDWVRHERRLLRQQASGLSPAAFKKWDAERIRRKLIAKEQRRLQALPDGDLIAYDE